MTGPVSLDKTPDAQRPAVCARALRNMQEDNGPRVEFRGHRVNRSDPGARAFARLCVAAYGPLVAMNRGPSLCWVCDNYHYARQACPGS